MNLELLNATNWVEKIKGATPISKKEADPLVEGLKVDLEKGKFNHAIRKLIALVILCPEKNREFTESILPKKIRPDLLDKHSGFLIETSQIFEKEFGNLKWAEFFKSLSHYTKIYKEISSYEFYVGRISGSRGFARGLLNLLSKTYWGLGEIPHINPMDGEEGILSPDSIADAVSYIFAIMVKYGKLSLESFLYFEISEFDYNEATELILNACKIIELKQIEAQLTHFGYQITTSSDCYVVSPGNEEIAIGLEWGHHRNYWAMFADIEVLKSFVSEQKADSWLEFYEKAYQLMGKFGWSVYSKPVERLVFAAPKEPFIDVLKDLFLSDKITQEEIRVSLDAYKEFCIEQEELFSKQIVDDLTFEKLLKMFRFLKFFIFCLKRKIFEIIKSNPQAVENTFFVIWTREEAISFFEAFGYEEKDVEAILKVMSVDLLAGKYVDILYRPILKINNLFCFVLSAIDVYKVPRTPLIANQVRFYDDGRIDPAVRTLEASFRDITDKIAKNIDFKYLNHNGEIDFLALYEDRLFVFESKNTLAPYSDMETRTMIDHLNKGTEQLKIINEYFGDEKSRNELMIKLKWDVSKIKCLKVVCALLINNRLFGGIRYQGFSVVHVHELTNFIDSGEIAVKKESGDKEKSRIQPVSATPRPKTSAGVLN